jgi:hypothetical protein
LGSSRSGEEAPVAADSRFPANDGRASSAEQKQCLLILEDLASHLDAVVAVGDMQANDEPQYVGLAAAAEFAPRLQVL